MRSIKNTSLSFGLVNVPVKMYVAVESHDIPFHQHHGGCGGQIGMVRRCKVCGEDVEFRNIVKGIERDGKLVIIDEADLQSVNDEQPQQIEVVQFCHADEIDPMLWERPYYLESNKGGEEGYLLLRQALTDSGLVGIARLVMRTRTTLAVLRVHRGVLVLHTISWPDEVRDVNQLKDLTTKAKAPSKRDTEVAAQLVQAMVAPFDPSEFTDTYTTRLDELITARAEDADFVPQPSSAADDPEDVSDLLAKLEASVALRTKKTAPKKPAAPKRRGGRTVVAA
jgi:DNA end-binding protein Ku